MATREENLKKINEELEQLSDEELDKIAGGTYSETQSLRKAIGEVVTVHGFTGNFNNPVTFKRNLFIDEVAPYLKKTYGIDSKLDCGEYDSASHDFVTEGGANKYSLNGKSLTHQQVLDIIAGK